MSQTKSNSLLKVIGTSSVGTMIEWYDFYIFGSLAGLISTKFFPQDNPTAAFLSTLATFAAGFVVRPFGALFFGRLGDLIGRKYTFMVTLILMGGATFLIGCVPSYESIGFMVPLLVLILRLLQGLALGGEYGGAATYVAEHAENNTRGYLTSWIQTTATLGLFISLLVIMTTKNLMSKEAFEDWGWRVPFWVSILMLVVSYFIRSTMHESPMFQKAKDSGRTSKNPLAESFGKRYNFKYVLLALLGATMGQGVIWYTGHYYSMNFLKNDCKVDGIQVEEIVAISLLLGTPLFVFFGWLSDKIGRKPIMLTGMLIAIFSYFPIYKAMYNTATNNKRVELKDQTTVSVTVAPDKKNPADSIRTTKTHKVFTDGAVFDETKEEIVLAKATAEPAKPKIKASTVLPKSDYWRLVWLIFIQIVFVTMVYGPIAAFLVEMFPTRIRYTSMSLPYHIGNGVFGGLMPAVALYLTNSAKEAKVDTWYLQGLWYPIIIAAVCFVIGLLFVNNRRHTTIQD